MNKYNLPAGVWDNPDEQDQQVYAEFVEVWNQETFDDSPVFSALSYYGGGDTYNETGSGGVVAGGCTQWFDKTTESNVTTLTIPVADDGYLDTESSTFDYDSTSIRVGGDGTNQYQAWFHFCGVKIPQGATITDAYLSFTSVGSAATTAIDISCEDVDNATTIESNADGQARTRTTASDPHFFFTGTYHSATYGTRRTHSLLDQFQEVISRDGWNENQSINLWMDYRSHSDPVSDGYLEIDSVESGAGATLTISYTTQATSSLSITCNDDGYWQTNDSTFSRSGVTIRYQHLIYRAFYHFPSVNIPEGATVCSAILVLYASSRDYNNGGSSIKAFDEDDSALLTDKADGTSRSLTTASETLVHSTWGKNFAKKDADFHAVIQEVIDREGWASGNDLQLYIDGTETQGAYHHSSDAANSAYHPELRLIYFLPPIEGEGGIVGGGSSDVNSSTTVEGTGGTVADGTSTNTTFVSEESFGGAATGGSSIFLKSSSPTTTGGVVLAGESISQVIINVQGGAEVSGEADLAYVANLMMEGGVLAGGESSIQSEFITSGGIVIAGEATPSGSTTAFTSGGVVVGGSSLSATIVSEVATGGLVVSQPLFENGFTHRTSVTVPSGSVASDMVFYLGVRLNVISDEFLITDMDGHVQSHEVREITETDTCLFWNCQLVSEQDNVFLVYLNLEDS